MDDLTKGWIAENIGMALIIVLVMIMFIGSFLFYILTVR